MYQVVGQLTGKVYVEGDSRADCLRRLAKKYPYPKNNTETAVYKEPLLINKL